MPHPPRPRFGIMTAPMQVGYQDVLPVWRGADEIPEIEHARPGVTRDAIGEAVDAGFLHIVLGLPAPYPDGVARWVADELVTPWAGAGPWLLH